MHRTNCRGKGESRSKSRSGTGDPLPGIVAGVVSAGVLLVAFGALALGVEAWWVAFPVGYGGVLPLSVGLARWRAGDRRQSSQTGARLGKSTKIEESTRSADAESAALSTLRRRYAEGEIDEVEFEHRVETLLRGVDSSSSDR